VKASDVVEAIDRFFLDVIGNVAPGIALLLGCWIVLGQPALPSAIAVFPPGTAFHWMLIVAAGYGLGNAITSIGQTVILPLVELIAVGIRKAGKRLWFPDAFPTVKSHEDLMSETLTSEPFVVMTDQVKKKYPEVNLSTNAVSNVLPWRNIALTIIQDETQLIHRFMFISIFNLGIASVLLLLAFIWVFAGLLRNIGVISVGARVDFVILFVIVIASFPFLKRQYEFYRRAIELPFSMAIIELALKDEDIESKDSKKEATTAALTNIAHSRLIKVYLAGGFHSRWQDRITTLTTRFLFLDPRQHGLRDNKSYTLWDLEAIRQSDVVFAYLETTNPAGYALALEVGFAKALGKRIILVDEKSPADEQTKRSLGMVRAAADVVFDSFEEGVTFMRTFENAA
jgi:hypothetical protein